MKFSTWPRLENGLWFALMILLPITSLPLISRLGGSTSVAAASLIPLALLLALVLLPGLLRGGTLPYASIPLLTFALCAALSGGLAFFLPIPLFRDVSLMRTLVEGMLTLGIGIAFYLVVSLAVRDTENLRRIFAWLNLAGALILAWSFAQAVAWDPSNGYPAWMEQAQGWVSASGNLYPRRVTGLAYEPSWLAHQLNMLFLPYWLAATVSRSSAHRFRLVRFLSLENLLLVGGVATLFLSLSRVGWLAFLVTVAFVVLDLNIRAVGWARARILRRSMRPGGRRLMSWLTPVLLVVLLLILYLSLFLGAAYALTRIDPRMDRLLDPTLLQAGGFTQIANQLAFAERVIYWGTGYNIFNDFPILGVGPGNAGFFFPSHMVPFGWELTETSTILYQTNGIPNVKSLWVRILAENGIIGFSLFASWLVTLAFSAARLRKKGSPFLRSLGWMGILALFALLVEGFSVDTYALPYLWLTFGFVTAASRLAETSG
jgi:hypothetical protein